MMGAAGGSCLSGCGRTQRPGMFLCSTCWREVPRHLQRDVTRTWSRVQGLREQPMEQRRAAMREYRQAREAALAAIA